MDGSIAPQAGLASALHLHCRAIPTARFSERRRRLFYAGSAAVRLRTLRAALCMAAMLRCRCRRRRCCYRPCRCCLCRHRHRSRRCLCLWRRCPCCHPPPWRLRLCSHSRPIVHAAVVPLRVRHPLESPHPAPQLVRCHASAGRLHRACLTSWPQMRMIRWKAVL